MERSVRPLDFVKTPGGGIAIIKELDNRGQSSILFINGCNPAHEKNAWWDPAIPEDRLEILDSLPRFLANAIAHPFGYNKNQGDQFFK